MAAYEIDHLFIFVSPGGPEARRLIDAGWREGPSNTHPGQGTSNRRFFARNFMLELLWVHDEDEADTTPRLELRERAAWRSGGASPFGVALRAARGTSLPPPFAAWSYVPGYLPPGAALWISADSDDARVPLLFAIDGYAPSEPAGENSAGADGPALAAARVWSPYDLSVVGACHAVSGVCPIRFVEGPEPLLELWFDEYSSETVTDLRPELPLVIHPARS